MQNSDVADKRQNSRFSYRGEVRVAGASQCTCSDISEVGLFVFAIQPFEKGNLLDLSFTVGGKELTVKGEVKYLQQGIGMGVAFRDLNDEQKAGLRELVDWLSDGDQISVY